jgi:hypothetical protein
MARLDELAVVTLAARAPLRRLAAGVVSSGVPIRGRWPARARAVAWAGTVARRFPGGKLTRSGGQGRDENRGRESGIAGCGEHK